ncbi:MAG: hypothetical protein H6832_09900 [Planctomycetes bacterium]|nr:hypothetical protein [Planctomycetota bacterium]MCB9891847.1 hypothetical protein [Planctomycetota bacterium]MCB9918703.1 hypothetical protein [Planctomycetota bacterium]
MSFLRVARRNRVHEQAQKQSLCAKCMRAVPREKLEEIGGEAICVDCRQNRPGPFEAVSARRTRIHTGSSPMRSDAMDDAYVRAGNYFEYGLLIVRCVLYLGFFVLAQRSDLARHAFQGFLVADFGAWLVQSIFEFRRDPQAVLLELGFFGIILYLFDGRAALLGLPPSPTDRAVVGLVFLFYFSVRVVFYVLRRRYEGDQHSGAH